MPLNGQLGVLSAIPRKTRPCVLYCLVTIRRDQFRSSISPWISTLHRVESQNKNLARTISWSVSGWDECCAMIQNGTQRLPQTIAVRDLCLGTNSDQLRDEWAARWRNATALDTLGSAKA